MLKHSVTVCLSFFAYLACLFQVLADVPSRYLRNNNRDTVIVFVHGVLSGADTAWQAPTTSFPELVAKDSTFDNADIFILSYPTSLWATMPIDELAASIGTTLKADRVLDHTNLIFVTHSMGGLVTKKFLLKTREAAARTKFIYFYSTPMEGSSLAALATIISSNPQFSGMQPIKSYSALGDLMRDWVDAKLTIPTYCAYEMRKMFGVKVVEFQSASAQCNARILPIDTDHGDIVKPPDADSASFLALKVAFIEQMGKPTSSLTPATYKLFEQNLRDLNTNLIRSREELFPEIDAYIQTPTEPQWNIVRDTAGTLLTEISAAVRKSVEFDSQFVTEGNAVLLIADDAKAHYVDRTYRNVFAIPRQEWNGHALVLRIIQQQVTLPTSEQAKQWRDALFERFNKLNDEMTRLIDLIQKHT